MRRLLVCLAIAACTRTPLPSRAVPAAPSATPTLVNGAGSTFVFPLLSKVFSDYVRVDPRVRFNYQSIGSGAGIRQITDRTVDFGASDAPLTDEQLAKAPDILHLPIVLGAVAVAYNLPSKPALRLTPDLLAGLYLGEITRWNDPRIAAVNPGVSLPSLPVAVIHRADGSGTTAIFTDYLAKVSPTWAQKVRHGTAVRWPVGIGGKGNEGVAGQLMSLPGAVGYVELAYAVQNKLPVASLANRAGEWIAPSVASTTAAATGAAASMPDDLRVSVTDPPGVGAYPIAGFTDILVFRGQTDPVKGPALARFLWWEIHDGQREAEPLLYAPLPPAVVAKVAVKIRSITLAGKPILVGQPE